jgi:ankyrin repeat-rich membrane spanning protein
MIFPLPSQQNPYAPQLPTIYSAGSINSQMAMMNYYNQQNNPSQQQQQQQQQQLQQQQQQNNAEAMMQNRTDGGESMFLQHHIPVELDLTQVQLSKLSCEEFLNLVGQVNELKVTIDNLAPILRDNAITGRVLLCCDLNELKSVRHFW